jgi:DNA-directed RNA polymerase subunit RPC12/RpoP
VRWLWLRLEKAFQKSSATREGSMDSIQRDALLFTETKTRRDKERLAMTDQTDWYRVCGLTREDDVVQVCKQCLSETWSPEGNVIYCDECGSQLLYEEEEE